MNDPKNGKIKRYYYPHISDRIFNKFSNDNEVDDFALVIL